jgi:hypothetical protein
VDLGIAFYPYRFIGSSSIASVRWAADSLFVPIVGDDHFNLPLYALADGTRVPGQYFSRADTNGTAGRDFLAFVTYYGGPLYAGILGSYTSYHIGSEALLIDPNNPPVFPVVPQDSDFFHGTAFMKYNNGCLFFNAEAAWFYWTDRWSGDLNAVAPNQNPGGTVPNPTYVEQWRYMVEFGVISGPARLSLLIIGKQPAAFVRHPNFDNHLGNYSLFRPYALLFSYTYGAGIDAYNLNGTGYVRDAFVLATRLDYALASNLNLFGTFFYADRTSHGYSWGCIGPNAGRGAFPATPDGNVNFNFNRYPASPNIPDRTLGYEIDVGFDWKLLEGCTAGVLVGYWQPGKWFSYACIDRSVPAWETGAPGNLFGTRPDRGIDPVIGGGFALIFAF